MQQQNENKEEEVAAGVAVPRFRFVRLDAHKEKTCVAAVQLVAPSSKAEAETGN